MLLSGTNRRDALAFWGCKPVSTWSCNEIQQVAVDEHAKDAVSVWIASGVVLMLGPAGRRGQFVYATRMLGR